MGAVYYIISNPIGVLVSLGVVALLVYGFVIDHNPRSGGSGSPPSTPPPSA